MLAGKTKCIICVEASFCFNRMLNQESGTADAMTEQIVIKYLFTS